MFMFAPLEISAVGSSSHNYAENSPYWVFLTGFASYHDTESQNKIYFIYCSVHIFIYH